jgi:hypothetical protein
VCIVVVDLFVLCSCLCLLCSSLVCTVVIVCVYCCSCLVCIVVVVCVYCVVVLCVLCSLVCIVVVVLCVLLSSYVHLLHYVCIAIFTLDAGLLGSSQYSEGPATGHLHTGFSRFPSVYKQTLRRFPTFQVATTCFSCSPPDLNLFVTNFMFCIRVK